MTLKRPIGSAVRLQRDAVPVDPAATYRNVGVLNHGRGLFEKPALMGAATTYPALFRLHRNQLVYSKLFAWEGSVTVVSEEFDGAFVSSEFPTFDVDEVVADAGYLRHVTAWGGFIEQLSGLTSGLGQRRQRVNVDQFLSASVPLPDLPEQRRIAAHLDQIEQAAASVSVRIDQQEQLLATDQLPNLVAAAFERLELQAVALTELADVVHETIHPGVDVSWAEAFVGLEHVESHTGRTLGSRVIGDESGRKFRFDEGDITFGYLRPYLNKVWVADRSGLCSVEQFVLRPKPGIDAGLLAHVLRSSFVLEATASATNRLQLPRVKLGTLMAINVPDVRRAPVDLLEVLDRLRDQFVLVASVRGRRRGLVNGILTSARNEIFSAMR